MELKISYFIILLIILYLLINKKNIKNIININNFGSIETFVNIKKKNYLFKNQYLIVKKNINHNNKILINTKKILFDDFHIYKGDLLEDCNYKNQYNKILILGFIIDPYNYKLNNLSIAKNICNSNNLEEVFEKIQKLSGRFVIYLNLNGNKIILNDCCSLKKIYYMNKNNTIFSSSEKILRLVLNKDLNISKDKKEYINSVKFKKSEFKWYDNSGYTDNTKILLPNTYYDLNKNNYKRIPFFLPKKDNLENISKKISKIIKNSIICLLHREKELILPITAGSDSRVLLACCKNFINKINFYIFSNNNLKTGNKVDTIVSNFYAKKYNLNFKNVEINDDKLDDNFKHIFVNNYIIPRILPKTKNIEYHLYNNQNKININGNCAEVLKENFNNIKKIINLEDFKKQIRENNNIEYINNSLEKYFYNNNKIANKYNIDICNIYHWELQQGLWGGLFPHEQDISIEEFSPFNNRELLLLGLSLDKKYRNKKNSYLLFDNIINQEWSNLMEIKFNPKISEIENIL